MAKGTLKIYSSDLRKQVSNKIGFIKTDSGDLDLYPKHLAPDLLSEVEKGRSDPPQWDVLRKYKDVEFDVAEGKIKEKSVHKSR